MQPLNCDSASFCSRGNPLQVGVLCHLFFLHDILEAVILPATFNFKTVGLGGAVISICGSKTWN